MSRVSQLVSLDLIISIVLLMLFISLVIVFLPSEADRTTSLGYSSQIFMDIEDVNHEVRFLDGYRIDESKLEKFSDLVYESRPQKQSDMKYLLMGRSDFNSYNSDVCLFFLDRGGVKGINGHVALGLAFDSEGKSSKSACNVANPCEHYLRSHAYTKPVLRNGRIMKMMLVVCET